MSFESVAESRPRRRSLVDEVRDLLADELILSGALHPGQLLPSEKELSERYRVSRVTLRASMRSLQEAGLIKSRHGVGWVILPRTLTQSLDRLCSLETFAREDAQIVTTEGLEWLETPADNELAEKLGVSLGEPVVVVKRIKVFNGVRVAWHLDFVPANVMGLETLKAEYDGSILDVFLAHREIGLEYADTEIVPVNLPVDIATRLRVSPGGAALFVEAVASTSEGRVVEWTKGWLLPEHFRFLVRRRRQIRTEPQGLREGVRGER